MSKGIVECKFKIQVRKALIREDRKVDRVCNMNKFLKMSGMVIVSILLTFIFFWTNFQHTYNACVIVLIFMLVEICISFLCNKREVVSKRGIIIAAICGFVLSTTSLIGSSIENGETFFWQSPTLGLRSALFLAGHSVLLGIVSLCLFIKLEEMSNEQLVGCKAGFLSKYACGGGAKSNLVFNCFMLAAILYFAFPSASWWRKY